MSNKIYFIVFIMFYYSRLVLGSNYQLYFTTSQKNIAAMVWIDDNIVITVRQNLVSKWFFDDVTLVELVGDQYIYTNLSLLMNAVAT